MGHLRDNHQQLYSELKVSFCFLQNQWCEDFEGNDGKVKFVPLTFL